MATREEYEAAFAAEAANVYPAIDDFERQAGHAYGAKRLEGAAKVLACPVKKNPPCWQHGRVIYAVARKYLSQNIGHMLFLDIGTAKGFSALAMAWASWDAKREVDIVSLDVVDPYSRVPRNSIADLEQFNPEGKREYLPRTVPELVEPFTPAGPEAINFYGVSSSRWLARLAPKERINLAFVDGKHSFESVSNDAKLIAGHQLPGDVMIFDDMQIAGISKAVGGLQGYEVSTLTAHADRRYAVAYKR